MPEMMMMPGILRKNTFLLQQQAIVRVVVMQQRVQVTDFQLS